MIIQVMTISFLPEREMSLYIYIFKRIGSKQWVNINLPFPRHRALSNSIKEASQQG